MHNWASAISGRLHSKWGESGDVYGQCVGHCVWWWVEQYWCNCSVSTARILHWRSESGSDFFIYCSFLVLLFFLFVLFWVFFCEDYGIHRIVTKQDHRNCNQLVVVCADNHPEHYQAFFLLTDAVSFLNTHFGASSGTRTVYLDEVQCTGRETNLTDCPRSSTVNCSSVHSYAGVRCQGLEKQQMMLHIWPTEDIILK